MPWQITVRKFLERHFSYIEHIQANLTIFVLMPVYYIYLITAYRADLARVLGLNYWWQGAFVVITTFLYMNSVDNLLQNIKAYMLLSEFEPEYHKRLSKMEMDYLGKRCYSYILIVCIGMHNKRYYFLYLIYMTLLVGFISLCSFIYLYKTMGILKILQQMVFSAVNIFDLFYFVEPVAPAILFFMFNAFLFIVAFGVLYYRGYKLLNTLLKGCSWEECLIRTFGVNWLLAIFWPSVESPEPEPKIMQSHSMFLSNVKVD